MSTLSCTPALHAGASLPPAHGGRCEVRACISTIRELFNENPWWHVECYRGRLARVGAGGTRRAEGSRSRRTCRVGKRRMRGAGACIVVGVALCLVSIAADAANLLEIYRLARDN